jgi:hypothetical protein
MDAAAAQPPTWEQWQSYDRNTLNISINENLPINTAMGSFSEPRPIAENHDANKETV